MDTAAFNRRGPPCAALLTSAGRFTTCRARLAAARMNRLMNNMILGRRFSMEERRSLRAQLAPRK